MSIEVPSPSSSQHFYFAAGALELYRRRQGHDLIGRMGRPSVLGGQVNRWCGKNLNRIASADVEPGATA
jgi:hypothetical protein